MFEIPRPLRLLPFGRFGKEDFVVDDCDDEYGLFTADVLGSDGLGRDKKFLVITLLLLLLRLFFAIFLLVNLRFMLLLFIIVFDQSR